MNNIFKELSEVKNLRNLDSCEDLEKYGFTQEALPLVAAGAIGAAVIALVAILRMIWKSITDKSESLDAAENQIIEKESNFEKLVGKKLTEFKGSTPNEVLAGDQNWTKRDIIFLEKVLKEDDLIKVFDEMYTHTDKIVSMYGKLKSDVINNLTKDLEEMSRTDLSKTVKEKGSEAAKKIGIKDSTETEKDSEKTGKAYLATKKIYNDYKDIFNYSRDEAILEKVAHGVKHTWVDATKADDKEIDANIKSFYEKFKEVMKGLSEKVSVTEDQISKAGVIDVPKPSKNIKKGNISDKLKSLKLEDEIKAIESLGKSIDEKFKDKPDAIKYARQNVNDIKSILILLSTTIRITQDLYLNYCGMYNRLLFVAVATHAYAGREVTSEVNVATKA